MSKSLKIKTIALVLGVVSVISFWGTISAQEGNVILTWQADSFYPADYKGKAPATSGSTVNISAAPVLNNRLVSPSSSEFIWRVNDHLFDKGIGMDEISFDIDEVEGTIYSVSVLVRGESGEYSNSIKIPVGSPELVIENPRPSKFVDLGEKVVLEAVPYFFNVDSLSELSFSWRIDNTIREEQKTNSLILDIENSDTLKGTDISVTGVVMNKSDLVESVNSNLELKIR